CRRSRRFRRCRSNYVRPDCVGAERVPFYCIDSVVNRHVNRCEPDEPARRWHGGDGDDGFGRVPVPIKNCVRARDPGSRGDGKRKCDENWQDWYFFKLSEWIHCCSFLWFRCLAFISVRRERATKVII